MFLEEMAKLCENLQVKELRFSWLIEVGRFKENPQLYPKRKWLSIVREIESLKEKYKNKISITIHRKPKIRNNNISQTCPGGNELFFLNPVGKLSSCSWVAKTDSNFITKDSLKEQGIKELIKTKEILGFKKMIQTRKNKDFKGCPFMAKHQNGFYYSNDNLIK